MYYLAFSNDSPRTRALVYGVYVVEMTQTFLLSYTAFKTFATGFGNINAIIDGSVLWFSIPIMSSAGTFVNALRCSLLTRNGSGIRGPGLLRLPYQCPGEIESRRNPYHRSKYAGSLKLSHLTSSRSSPWFSSLVELRRGLSRIK